MGIVMRKYFFAAWACLALLVSAPIPVAAQQPEQVLPSSVQSTQSTQDMPTNSVVRGEISAPAAAADAGQAPSNAQSPIAEPYSRDNCKSGDVTIRNNMVE
jgi:hypothetical protein